MPYLGGCGLAQPHDSHVFVRSRVVYGSCQSKFEVWEAEAAAGEYGRGRCRGGCGEGVRASAGAVQGRDAATRGGEYGVARKYGRATTSADVRRRSRVRVLYDKRGECGVGCVLVHARG